MRSIQQIIPYPQGDLTNNNYIAHYDFLYVKLYVKGRFTVRQ